MSLNTVVLLGNVTRSPETKVVGGDKTVSKFGLALNSRFGQKEETTYVDIECWGKTAETVSAYVDKGRQVAVTGRLKQDNWEDKDGNKRSKLFVVADSVKFIGSREKGETAKTKEEDVTSDIPDDDVPF